MANQRLMKKVAPVVLSAAVAMTSMPATAFAADFSDTEVTVAEEVLILKKQVQKLRTQMLWKIQRIQM